MRSTFTLLVVLVLVLALVSPAFAHVLVVSPKGSDVKIGRTGSPALPEAANGNGLIAGGPTGSYKQSPSHAKGLNTACEALKISPAPVEIFGPPTNAGCAHGQ